MLLWDPIFIYDSIVPLFMMIILGYFLWRHHPKQISVFVGYRTSYSTKNLDTWNFAHEYCGRLLWKIGWILELAAFIVNLHIYGSFDSFIMMIRKILPYIQFAMFILVIILTEMMLRKTFTKDGARK